MRLYQVTPLRATGQLIRARLARRGARPGAKQPADRVRHPHPDQGADRPHIPPALHRHRGLGEELVSRVRHGMPRPATSAAPRPVARPRPGSTFSRDAVPAPSSWLVSAGHPSMRTRARRVRKGLPEHGSRCSESKNGALHLTGVVLVIALPGAGDVPLITRTLVTTRRGRFRPIYARQSTD